MAEAEPAKSAVSSNDELPACTSAFDALWFCYSPGNQFKKYYRDGTYDDCDGYHRMFELCMKVRWLEVNGKMDSEGAKSAIAEMKAMSTKATKNHVWRMKRMGEGSDLPTGSSAGSAEAVTGENSKDHESAKGGWGSWLRGWGGGN